jgi:hypothetical protein
MQIFVLIIGFLIQVFTLEAAALEQRDEYGRRILINHLEIDRSSFSDECVFLYTPECIPGHVPLVCIYSEGNTVRVEIRKISHEVLEGMLPTVDEPISTIIKEIESSKYNIVKEQLTEEGPHYLSTMMSATVPLVTLKYDEFELYQLFLLEKSLSLTPKTPDLASGVSQITIAALDSTSTDTALPGARFLNFGGLMVSGLVNFGQVDFLKGNFVQKVTADEPVTPCFATICDVLALVIRGAASDDHK